MAPENAASVKFSVYLAKKERELEDAQGCAERDASEAPRAHVSHI
jgi:hypothetical protein